MANKALLRINDAAREHGQIRAFNNRTYDLAKAPPTVVLRNEDYGRIDRLLADGEPWDCNSRSSTRRSPKGTTHLQRGRRTSGHRQGGRDRDAGRASGFVASATGATDNAIGASMMMEAARVIQALGLKPRRTIRVALWSARSRAAGFAGLREAALRQLENPKPEYGTLDCYFNIDSGTGRVRGASVFGPPEAATIVRAALAPFEDLGVAGALPSQPGDRRTDSTSFNNAGLAGIGMQQDPIEYQSATWHTIWIPTNGSCPRTR